MTHTDRLLITGADGFAGRWLTRAALSEGWQVVAAISPEGRAATDWLDERQAAGVTEIRGDLRDDSHRRALASVPVTAVVHLAALASGAAARQDPLLAWTVNAGVTAALAEALAERGSPRFLLISSGEVYGAGHQEPIGESATIAPISPYAASKVGAEIAVGEVARRLGLPLMIARPFPHTGPGQSTSYVYPALVARLRRAREDASSTIAVGNLTPVRDLLDVRDVVAAYLQILVRGEIGGVYNIASGSGESLATSLQRLAGLLDWPVQPQPDPSLVRQADISVLIGDATRLQQTTGWRPTRTREQIFRDLIDAQTD